MENKTGSLSDVNQTTQDAQTILNSPIFKTILKDRISHLQENREYGDYEAKANALAAFQNHEVFNQEEIGELIKSAMQTIIKTSELVEKFREQVGWDFQRLREAAIKAQNLAWQEFLKTKRP